MYVLGWYSSTYYCRRGFNEGYREKDFFFEVSMSTACPTVLLICTLSQKVNC